MWLEADVMIRRLSHGKKSLDDVARAFFGREDTGPRVVPYTRDDVIAALAAVQPYDWRAFLAQRVDAVAPHPPDPFDPAGWHLVYTPVPSALDKLQAGRRKTLDARYSLGFVGQSDGSIVDVIDNSPAARAGLGPGLKLVAINGRAADGDAQKLLDTALREAQTGANIALLVRGGDLYRTVVIDYHGGPRYPHLERIAGAPDGLAGVTAPLP
jgi:predicted metalloprotease with PDZ domain